MNQPAVVLTTELRAFPRLKQGKVRDVYQVDADRLLLVASDRISAFDCVLPSGIPRKGEVLTQLSRFWFDKFRDVVPNHMVTADFEQFPPLLKQHEYLRGRSMLVRAADVIPFECVVRGYLAGSGWKEYQQSGSIGGRRLPAGLVESARLPEPIFTPATKAATGHDVNVSEAYMANQIGVELTKQLSSVSLRLYQLAADHLLGCGLILCDTKFEFGLRDGHLMWIDEALTPDSSRFWDLATYSPGRPQESFDKQFVRDYLETLAWDKTPPAPALPPAIVQATSERYLEAYRRITGQSL
ncbi:MAG: phosphoribosylaminoimidazolesuccinocarboxamide synthase [Acidobacteriota bacterium]|nr:phosphoribosylaminoimidazolesuccinocarboxamide synthase [Blastocatellia bacterium]MDW8238148.1 phosphoribosylaminoimidazolesuccinocarboxamide synthase [Acidobacteriota bacterium]